MDGASAFGASEPTLILTSGAGSTKLMNLVVYGGSPSIQWNCGECQAYNVNAAFAYAGNANGIVAEWYIQGGGGELYNVSADDAEYPYGVPTPPFTYTAWATNQSVATNAVRTATCQDGNSYVIQAKAGGTTAASGTGPTCKNYGGNSQTFTDGTVTWSLSHPTLLYHWQIDTGSADVHIHQADTGGGNVGIGLTNTLAGNPPTAFSCVTCNGSTSYAAQVDGVAGNGDIVFIGSLFAGPLETGGVAVKFESTFLGGVSIVGGAAHDAATGISIAGGTNYRISGVDLTQNTTALSISGAASKITALGNNTNGATTGASISGTASDTIFANNVGCVSGATTCVTNTSSGANVITTPNDDGTIFNTTSVTTPNLYGGTAAGAGLVIRGTSSGSPSGDSISEQASDIILRNPGTGTSLVQIGLPNTTPGQLEIANSTNTASIVSAAGASETLIMPNTSNDTFAVLAAAQILINKTISGASNTLSNIANASLTNSATTVAGAACTLGSTCGLSIASNALSSSVSLNNTSNYFDGPSMAQGTTGTWFASGGVTVIDSAQVSVIRCKLWDGTTIIDSGEATIPAGAEGARIALSGYLASPAANIRISCRDITSTGGNIEATVDSTSNTASKVSGVRID